MTAGQKGRLGQFHLFLLDIPAENRKGWVETALIDPIAPGSGRLGVGHSIRQSLRSGEFRNRMNRGANNG
jgi:hypothetical protein